MGDSVRFRFRYSAARSGRRVAGEAQCYRINHPEVDVGEANQPAGGDGVSETRVENYHVYRVAMIVAHELEDIWDHVGLAGEAHLEVHHGKSVADAYDDAHAPLADLQQLAGHDRFAIPGGVVLLNRRSGEIHPGDVMDVLNAALAELAAMKVAVGSPEPVEFAMPTHADHLPTNFYDAIDLCRALVDGLEKSS